MADKMDRLVEVGNIYIYIYNKKKEPSILRTAQNKPQNQHVLLNYQTKTT